MSNKPGRDAAAAQSSSAGPFIVERRLPKVSQRQLSTLQAALLAAATRFTARGEGVRYLRSIFLARQDRLLSLFTADSLDIVRAVSEASLVPFTSIEPAVELPGSGSPSFPSAVGPGGVL